MIQSVTSAVKSINADSALLEKITDFWHNNNTENLLEMFKDVEAEVNKIYDKDMWVKIENKSFYYCKKGGFYAVDPSRHQCANSGDFPNSVENVPTTYPYYDDFCNYLVSVPFYRHQGGNISYITNKDNTSYYYFVGYYSGYRNFSRFHTWNAGSNKDYNENRSYAREFSSDKLRLPISRKSGFQKALKYNLMPEGLSASQKELFQLMVQYQEKNLLTWNGDEIAGFSDEFYRLLRKNEIDDFKDVLFKKESIENALKSGTAVALSGEGYKDFVELFTNSDTVRANITPYETARLTDVNSGHWELWNREPEENEIKINLENTFYGRNPLADVRRDGIVGIDFGTKSTVVTYQNGSDTTVPMRIGGGDYSKDISANDYENPTVMEFINLSRFLERYNEKAGRPRTEWADMTISHTASELLNSPESAENYYAWFSDLKQWASDKNRKMTLKDKNGLEKEMSPFIDISSDELNPIELYAYMLGLFINNMYNGIYINYIMSFPVTYERKIRMKISESFEKGLKKSLPEEVLQNKEIMQEFRVMEGASEPAAYAVCALQEYGFDPQEDEKVLYGVFDFGGGTTDFDYGIWQRASKKQQRRYDNVIRHFGAGGDRYLGGENMLELLSYHVFRKNEKLLRENKVQFTKPTECEAFAGSEILIGETQQAKFNMRQLSKELRPLWEGQEYEKTSVMLNLRDTDGESRSLELSVDTAELYDIIRKRIDKGVDNFFEAMRTALSADSVKEEIVGKVDKIQIFLAGNSSKSEMVRESFDEYIEKYTPDFRKLLNIEVAETPEKTKNYLVKKYDNDEIKASLEACDISYDSLENDSFIQNMTREDLINFFWNLCNKDKKYDKSNIIPDLIELWKEGVLSIIQLGYAYGEIKNENVDIESEVVIEIASFIYSHSQIPMKIRREIENNDFIKAKFSQEVANATLSVSEYENNKLFVLYAPLGTAEANAIQSARNIMTNNNIIRPNGKLGVAYGLLSCRIGSRIKVESEIKETDEIKFNFFTGFNSRGKFEVVTDRNIKYKEWVEFIDASESDFELYYTDLPEASNNQMSIQGVRKKICKIDETMDDAMVYIRAVEPSVLEYAAAYDEESLKNQEYLSAPKRIVLE